jgi:hypothetical protein
LLGFAVVSYPRLLPQVTRMATGLAPGDPMFAARWEDFLRRVGPRFQSDHDGPWSADGAHGGEASAQEAPRG